MHRRSQALWALLGVGLALGTGTAAAERVPADPERGHATAGASRPDSSRTCFAVLGQVARPGVHEFSTTFPLLQEVIDRAGGLTADASGSLQIVRHGRAGQYTSYSPDSTVTAFPGDVIIAHARSAGGSAVQPAGHRVHRESPPLAARSSPADPWSMSADGRVSRGAPEPADPGRETVPLIHVACVQLVDRPVVLSVPAERARLDDVLSELGQSHLVPSVRVIQAGRPAETERGSVRLAADAVLVFDPKEVQKNRLPPLPKPLPKDSPSERLLTQSPPPVPLTADGLAAPLRDVLDDRQAAADPARRSPTGPEASNTRSKDQPGSQGLESELQRQPDDPPTIPGSDRDSTEAAQAAKAGPSGTAAEPVRTGELEDQEQAAISVAGTIREASPGGLAATLRRLAVWTLSIGAAALLLALLLAVRSRRRGRRVVPEPAAAPAARAARLLDVLIRNELPVVEEPVRIPGRLELYGRPRGARGVRIDSAAPVLDGKPHWHGTVVRNNASAGLERLPIAEPLATEPSAAINPIKADTINESLSGSGDRHPPSCGGTDINPQHLGPSPLFRTDTESLSGKGDRHPTCCGDTDIDPPGPSPLFRTDTEIAPAPTWRRHDEGSPPVPKPTHRRTPAAPGERSGGLLERVLADVHGVPRP